MIKININKIMDFFSINRHMALAIMLIGIGAVATALTAQHVFGIKPCQLCIYQRVVYFFNIVLGFSAFAAAYRYPRVAKLIIALSIVVFAVGGCVAAYQAGLEYGWWKAVDTSCGLDSTSFAKMSVDQLKMFIGTALHEDCTKPSFVLFGISMAGYNFVGTTVLVSILSYLSFFRCRNNQTIGK